MGFEQIIMVIKIKKKKGTEEVVRYKSTKKILTPADIKDADRFDHYLREEIAEIEKILTKNQLLTSTARKADMLKAWHLIGSRINSFLGKNKVSAEEEQFFWDYLYKLSPLINKTVPTQKISKTRNDFRIASLLAYYPLKKLQKVGFWALWREMLAYKSSKDKRVLNWLISQIDKYKPKTRNEARPLLKAVAARLKKIDTTVLNDKELIEKLEEVNW